MLDPALLSETLSSFFKNPEDLERSHEALDLITESAEADKSALLSIIPLMIVAARGLEFGESPNTRTDDEHAKLVIDLSEEALCDYVNRIAHRSGLDAAGQRAVYRNFIFCIHFVSEVLVAHTTRLLKTTNGGYPLPLEAQA